MLEGILADLLNKYIGKYVENLDAEDLKVGIWNGKLELTNLQLRPEALFELDLPVEVKAGYIGKITVSIPWSSVYSSPFEVVVEDVYVLAGPVTDRKYDAKREKDLQNAIKRSKLEVLENKAKNEEEDESNDQGFIEKLTATIINNIQVSVQRIHVRYEDGVSMGGGHVFACGFMLDMLEAKTTNSSWQPAQVDSTAPQVHKLVTLHGLSVYWNPHTPEHGMVRNRTSSSAWRNILEKAIRTPHRCLDEDLDFIVKPISTTAKLVFNKDSQANLPQILADVDMDEIELLVSRQQFLNMLSLSESFKMMSVNQRYRKYSPGVGVQGNARAWWLYGYNAVLEEYIRPFSWYRIKLHRQRYKSYKDTYKQYLLDPKNKSTKNQLLLQEDSLDLTNIVMAREQAKIEFAVEKPERAKKKKKKESGWLSWIWGSDDADGDDVDTVILSPDEDRSLPYWLDQMEPDERNRLFEGIGYNTGAPSSVEHSQEYVAHKLSVKISTFSLSLVNYGREVLKVSLWQLMSSFENRPESEGYRAMFKTEKFIVEGVSVELDLVPLITSEISVYAPPNSEQLLRCEFEQNPTHVQADYAARLNIQPIEVVYDEHAVTEVIAFFQVANISTEYVKSIAYASLERAVSVSRAGLQYAIEQHKTLHLSVNMRSPYIVIPEHGTLHRGGNVVVIDLGKLKVESDLQPKNISLEELTMSEIESRLYDKFNITVTEVKVLVADSGDDWHTAQIKHNSEFHILPAVGMKVTFFNSVQPQYRDLPKQKCEVRVETLELSLSDEKLVNLSAFARNIPVPRSSSMMAIEDCVDGGLDDSVIPVPLEVKDCQVEPSMNALLHLRRAVHRNSVVRKKPKVDPANRYSVISTASENYYSASDHSDEEVEDWARGLDVPAVDDHTSDTNTINVLARFTLAEVLISVSKSADKIDTPYLMLRVNRLCADAAITVYGLAVQASLGGVQLVDKIHLSSSGEYLELLGSKSSSELITAVYRKVEPQCPDFESVYGSLEQGMVVKISSLKFTFDRAAIIYLNTFIQGLLISIQPSNMSSSLHRSTSTILSTNVAGDPHQPQPPNFIDRLTSQDEAIAPPKVTKFHLVARLGHLEVKLCEHDNDFAVVVVRDMEGTVFTRQAWWKLQACVGDLDISDLTDNSIYPKILSLDDDNALDYKMVSYNQQNRHFGSQKMYPVNGSIRLRMGRMETVLLYKFISEIQNFMEPFTNRETVESYKTAAQQAVHNKIQDVHEQGARYSLCIDLKAPVVYIPQNSASTNVLVVRLGDLSLKNYFEDSEIGGGVLQHWDHIYLSLDALTLMRGKLNLNQIVEPIHTIVKPINMKLDLKRALPPHHSEVHYDLSVNLHIIKVNLMESDLKVVMAVLRENMTEVSSTPDKVDAADLTPITDVPLPLGGVEVLNVPGELATTPVVEIEEPLLSAPEVSELIKQTKVSVVFDGMELKLLSEGDDPLETANEEGEGFAELDIGKLSMFGHLNADQTLEARLILLSITLIDIRENSRLAIKKLIRSAISGRSQYEDVPPMVDLTFKRNTDTGQQLELNLDTVRINLCVPYLLSIANFFTKSLTGHASPERPSVIAPNTPPSLPQPVTRRDAMRDTATVTSQMLSMRFKQLEVVLFAEPEDKHSRVLVLKANSQCNYISLHEHENFDAKIRQLQIISCVYGRANKTASMVLHPCDLEFTRQRESANGEVKMEAKITDVFLNISASTINVTRNAVGIILKNRFVEPVDTSDVSLGGSQHYDLWNTHSISAAPWLQPIDEADRIMQPVIVFNEPAESLKVTMAKVQLVFEVENLDYHVPCLCLKTSLNADVRDWSKQMILNAELCLDVCYFNEKLGVWEPLLEPVMEEEDEYRPYEVVIKVVKAPSHPISCGGSDLKLDKDDEIDGTINYLMKKTVRSKSDSSETDSDSENDMTVIRPRIESAAHRHGSHGSYDTVSHHSSIQGESDSESELLSNLTSTLNGPFSSDSSDLDLSDAEEDDDAFHSSEKPVFLTSKGPIHVESAVVEDSGVDEVDAPTGVTADNSQTAESFCYYTVIDSRDQLKLNVTTPALDVVKELSQALTDISDAEMKSVQDLPGFEIYNKLEFGVKCTLSPDTKDVDVGKHWSSARHRMLSLRGSIHHSPTVAVTAAYDDIVMTGDNDAERRKSEVYHSCHDVFEGAGDGVHEEAIHGVTVTNPTIPPSEAIDDVDGEKLIEIESEDDVDGIAFLSKAVSSLHKPRKQVAPYTFNPPSEDTLDNLSYKKDLGDERIHIKLEDFDDLYNVSRKKDVSRLIPLAPCKNDTQYHLHYKVDVQHGRQVVHLQSPLEVQNHMTVAMEVSCRTAELEKYCGHDVGTIQGSYTVLSVVEPGQTYHPPLYVAYHCRLYLTPQQLSYEKCSSGIWWQDLGMTNDKSRDFFCIGTQTKQKSFHFKVHCEARKTEREPVTGAPFGCLHIYPPVVLHNLLPYDMQFTLEGSSQSCITHGDNTPLYTADLTGLPKLKLLLGDYLGNDWTGSLELSHDLDEFKAIVMETDDPVSQQLCVSVHVDRSRSMDLYIYSPYWIINKTGLPVQIRGSRSDAVYQNDTSADPLLFRFKKHRRKKAKLRVHNSKWSRSFSLDTVASNGVVICKDKERNTKYQFLVQIQMSHLKLTKIVSIMPYFLVVNNTPHALRYMEENEQADLWLDITSRQVAPFWPCTNSMKMYVKYDDSNVASQHFNIHTPNICTLRMDKGTALVVEVAGGIEAPTTITFLTYDHGDAPVRVDNLCEDVFIKLHQKNQSQVSLLSPSQSVLYTWDDPTSERTLMWNVYNRKKPSYPAFISKDGSGEVQLGIQTVRRSSALPAASTPLPPNHKRKLNRTNSQHQPHDSSTDDESDEDVVNQPADAPLLKKTRTDKVTVYWVSYLDGLQRVLLLTQDERIASKAQKINSAEQATLAVFLSLESISVSIVNSLYEELALVSIMNGAPLWEVELKGKWKTLQVELSSWLEHQWRNDEGVVALEDIIRADLEDMTMTKPFMGALRRVANPGLWLQYRQSIHHSYIHTKIHRLQIDNQLCDAMFPTVLFPTPLPHYVVRKTGPKPFVEFAMMRRTVPEANIDTVKYGKLLVQEFSVRLDRGFLMSLLDLYSHQYTAQPESEQLAADLGIVRKSLHDVAVTQANSRPKRIVFEYLHFSPLKLRVSFSLAGRVHSMTDMTNQHSVASDLLDFFLNSVGATLTEIKDVELRMAFYEKHGALLTWDQVIWDVVSHYKAQAIQQAYVLILGLDVLGNPYGLVKDFTQGLGDFFYEPFAGSISSPDEFADNLVHGVRSLMGHTVGSLAGSASLITGSLGTTLAVLSFDKNYRKLRRRHMQQHPSSLPQSIFLAGKGFLVSLGLGLSGVVVNPIRGVKEEGLEGFFKGVGKGLMGLITKPTGGAVDMVSMAFDGLRRAAEMGEDVVVRMRAPRYIHPAVGLKPYSPYQAMGQRLLFSLNKGKYMETDVYFAHAALSSEEKADVLIVTDRHVILAEKGRFWSDYSVDWIMNLHQVKASIDKDTLILKIQREGTGYNPFVADVHTVTSTSAEVLNWLMQKIEQAKHVDDL